MNSTTLPTGAPAPFLATTLVVGFLLGGLRAQYCSTYVRVAAGDQFSAALRTDGQVAVFGYNSFGVLGVPALPTGTSYVEVVAGGSDSNHVVARRSDGALVAWGNNASGQAPASLPANNYLQVGAGASHSLALRFDGVVIAWGANGSGQCNVPTTLGAAADIAAGWSHSVALTTSGVVGWGNNTFGQLNLPALAPGLSYVDVAAGAYFTLARVSDGTLRAVGENGDGQCNVPAGSNFVQIAAGRHFAFARRSDGTIAAWGNGANGQTSPPALPPGVVYTDVAAGGYHGIAARSDGQVVAWGYNSWGQCNVPPLPTCGCQGSLVVNGGFDSGLVAGSMPPAQLSNWSVLAATPQVVDNDGYTTPGCVQMWGNQVVGEAIEQTLPTPLLAGHRYKVSLQYRATGAGGPLPLRIRIKAGTHDGLYPSLSTMESACLTPSTSSTAWTSFTDTFVPTANCPCVAICVENDYAVNDGNYVSWARVDDLCIREGGNERAVAGGCTPSGPQLEATAPSDLDSTVPLRTYNLPAGTTLGITMLGLTGFPGGIDLTFLGMPSCALATSLDVLMAWAETSGNGWAYLTIPDDSSWIGLHVYSQALTISPGANPFGALLTNAIELTVGW